MRLDTDPFPMNTVELQSSAYSSDGGTTLGGQSEEPSGDVPWFNLSDE